MSPKTKAKMQALVSEIDALRMELARVRQAHRSILNEVLYGGTDLSDEPDIDRIHNFARVGLRDMMTDVKTS